MSLAKPNAIKNHITFMECLTFTGEIKSKVYIKYEFQVFCSQE